jgi:hypothetical protein
VTAQADHTLDGPEGVVLALRHLAGQEDRGTR